MPFIPVGPSLRPAPAALAALALAVAAGPAVAAPAGGHHRGQPLVVRAEATAVDAPCKAGVCVDLTGGRFRGTSGAGAYRGSLEVAVADAFPNGEGGICPAPRAAAWRPSPRTGRSSTA